MRLHLDCTYTRLQSADVGITRVVRGLARGLREAQPELETGFVAWHRDGWRRAPAAEGSPESRGTLYHLSEQPGMRRLVKQLAPVALQAWAWRRFSRHAFSAAAQDLPPAAFGAGDILVAGDAAWGYELWPRVAAAARSGARVVTVLYDLIPVHNPQFCAPIHRRLFQDWLEGALRHSEAFLCISEATRAELERYCRERGLRCPPATAFRLGGELPTAGSLPARASVRDLARGMPCFLTVGSIEPRKNHALLLDAFELAWRQGLDARLVIVGRPVDGTQATLTRIRRHPELGRRLHLLTDCNDAELDLLYLGASAVILPSLAEGFGLPLAEARQRGCEVLASRLPAFEEIADAGVRFFAPGAADELAALVVAAAAAGGSRAAPMPAFGWRDSARQFMNGIERLLAAPRRTGA